MNLNCIEWKKKKPFHQFFYPLNSFEAGAVGPWNIIQVVLTKFDVMTYCIECYGVAMKMSFIGTITSDGFAWEPEVTLNSFQEGAIGPWKNIQVVLTKFDERTPLY